MRIGDVPPSASTSDMSPAEELHEYVLAAVDDASLLTRLMLADALKNGTPWIDLPEGVRFLFERVVKDQGF